MIPGFGHSEVVIIYPAKRPKGRNRDKLIFSGRDAETYAVLATGGVEIFEACVALRSAACGLRSAAYSAV